MNVLIFADNKFQPKRLGILRGSGAHRIATLLRDQGITTEVVDFYIEWSFKDLKQIIDKQLERDTLFIGFSCSLMFDGTENFSRVRNYIKSKNPDVSIVIGGYETTQKGFELADWYIEGYGEAAILALVDHLKDPTKEIKYDVDDKGSKVIFTRKHYPVNGINQLAIRYTESDFISKDEVLTLESARGCIFKCAFCDFQLLGKKKVDYLRDPDDLYKEILNQHETYGTTKFFLTEDTFNDTEQKVDMLLDITRRLPFKPRYMGYIRADLLASKPHTIPKLVEAGFTSMHFGIESFHEFSNKSIGKGMSTKRLKETLIHIKKDFPEVYVNGTFIVGLPGDTPEQVRESSQWLIDTQVMDFWTFNPLRIPTPHPFIYRSEFTNNFLTYGYRKMNEKEIKRGLDDNPEILYGTKKLPWLILWKNDHFNYFTAAKLAHEVNQQANPYKTIDAWTAFSISALGYDLEWVRTQTYDGIPKLDQPLINDQSDAFIDDYMKKKLDHIKNW